MLRRLTKGDLTKYGRVDQDAQVDVDQLVRNLNDLIKEVEELKTDYKRELDRIKAWATRINAQR